MRHIVELEDTVGLTDISFSEPVRLVFMSPRRGGPPVSAVRAALASKGKLRLSATALRLYADLDPGPAEAPIVALDTIARSDAEGLERMLHTVLPHVDEIVLGVDARSDEGTKEVARAYADTFFVFDAGDLGLTAAEWKADKIHFAKARNLGRGRVKAPWTFVIDTDEYVDVEDDLRMALAAAPETAEAAETMLVVGGMTYDDHQRLARTHLRWHSGTHNQLPHGGTDVVVNLVTVEDKTLREANENARRDTQRNRGIEELIDDAAKGDLSAIFHLAKHRAHHDDPGVAAKMAEDYRSRIEPHSVLADERAWLALAVAFRYYREDNLPEADRWAVRALLDGPRQVAFCLLGDIAEDQGDLARAAGWYECACAFTEKTKIKWPGVTELRWGRLAGIRMALAGTKVTDLPVAAE